MATLNGPDVMNAIRNAASTTYRETVPLAKYGNIQDVGNPILQYDLVANEFLNVLVNRIVATMIERKMFNNPLAFLKKGMVPLGQDIQDIYTNPAKAKDYDPDNYQGILTPEKPDTKVGYYRRNRRDKYKVTIPNEQLTAAFVSWGDLENFIASIVDTLYNGNSIGEFQLTKRLVGDATAAAKVPQVVVPNPTTEPTATSFLTEVRSTVFGMRFPSANYNSYALNGGTGDPVVTWSDASDLVIMIRADAAANVDVQKLSAAFNLSYADYVVQQVIVDSFESAPNMVAFIADRSAFQIRENIRRFTTFYNSEVMAWTYWYHCWDTFALSPFRNAVAFVTAEYPKP